MAYTKIHAIKATVDKAIDYICNPNKTDEQIYVSSYACAPETAAIDFKYTLDHCRENSPNKAYHLIQAFAPGEVSYEEAHRIGKELADKVLEGKYSYVLTTHIDKGHIHNHIIFCAADNIEHNKYHDCKQSYYHIRKLSDELCKAHNLSIIIPGGERGKKYKEWQSEQNGSTWKTQLRRDINFCIKSASTYEDFLLLMRAKGYEIKGESIVTVSGSIEEGAAKYISFRPLDKERLDCQHFFRQIFLGYFPDIVQAFDTLGRNVYGDDYTSLHNPIVLSSVLLVYGMFHSTQILF